LFHDVNVLLEREDIVYPCISVFGYWIYWLGEDDLWKTFNNRKMKCQFFAVGLFCEFVYGDFERFNNLWLIMNLQGN